MKRLFNNLLLILGLILPLTLGAQSFAGELKTYDAASFEKDQKAGKAILVDIKASWCPTCKRQGKILRALLTYPEFNEVQAYAVDFDSQKEAVEKFGAESQSTIIMFKGEKETHRSVGVTDQAALKKIIESGL